MLPKAVAVALLIIEVLFISTRFDALTVQTTGAAPLQWILSQTALLLQWLSVAAGAYLIVQLTATKSDTPTIQSHATGPVWPWLGLNLALFALFYFLTYQLFTPSERSPAGYWLLAGGWLLGGGAVLLSILRLAMPFAAYGQLWRQQSASILISLAIATLVTATSLLSKNLWPAVILPTFSASEWLLGLFAGDVISYPDKLYLGIDQFIVEVSSQCSGVEGMGLAISFTLLYLFMIRDQLRFPRAFILLPLAALISWLLNVVRITVLILLGEYVSADFAVGGFHSQAGWFTFIALALLIIVSFNRLSWVRKAPHRESADSGSTSQGSAILITFMLFLAGALIAGLDESAMNWLYPIKALAGLAAIIFFWRVLDIPRPTHLLEGVGLGLIALAIWLVMIPADADFNQQLGQSLSDSGILLGLLWLSLRFVGSIVVAPIIEELVFRSYLMARVADVEIDHHRPLAFHLLALICSSFAFAAIHNQWLAGFVVAVVFALARYRGNLSTAIVAHATTNGALCIYAITAGQWAYL